MVVKTGLTVVDSKIRYCMVMYTVTILAKYFVLNVYAFIDRKGIDDSDNDNSNNNNDNNNNDDAIKVRQRAAQ